MGNEGKKTNQRRHERLTYIDFCANYLGQIGRSDLIDRFGISDGSASKDIARYNDTAKHKLKYDFKTKKHKATFIFKPQYHFSASQVLKALSTGFGDTLEQVPGSFIQTATAVELNKPDPIYIAQISRGIHQNKIVEITYYSLSSGKTIREIAPFVLINSGLRWHVRAFDRKSKEFRDFVLARITSAKMLKESIPDDESCKNDENWTKTVNLEIVPHPDNIKEKRAIELDYGMKEGMLKLELRQSIAGYVLRNWNVDCTIDHQLREAHYQLWLKNSGVLRHLENVYLGPRVKALKRLKKK
jgi:hypothetical protein